MKKTLFAVLALPLLLCACDFKNLAMPKEVEVKTGATYEFNLIKLDSKKQEWMDFSKFLDIGKMISGEGEGEGSGSSSQNQFELLKYKDGSTDYQQLLMHMPLQKIDFNLGDQFSNMDFSKQIQGFELNEEIKIPELQDLNQKKALDLSGIQTVLNAGITFNGVTSSSISVEFASKDNFQSIEYSSGNLLINADGASGNVRLIYNSNTVSSATFSNGKAYIPLAGVVIHNEGMKLSFDSSGQGFIASISNGKIATATGITLDNSLFNVNDVETEFDINMSENIEECTVNDGTFTIKIEKPAGWSDNVINDYTVNVTGGLEVSVSKSSPTENLIDETLKPEKIKAHAHVDIKLDGSTIVFTNPPEVDVSVKINKISAKIKLPDNYNTNITNQKTSLAELSKYVTNIKLKESGFKITVNNTLPSGNDITLGMTCPFVGITSEQSHTFSSGNHSENYVGDDTELSHDIDADSEISLSASIGLPHPSGNSFTVSNVVPGQNYALNIKIDPIFNWTQATVKLPEDAANRNIEGVFESNINKGELFKTFGETFANTYADRIQFASLPLYIYAELPDLTLFQGASYGGNIKAYYGKKADPNDENEKPSKVGTAEASLLNGNIALRGMPELTKDANGFVNVKLPGQAINFQDAFNLAAPEGSGTEGSSLCIDYNIKLNGAGDGELTIEPDDLKNASSTSISIDIVLLLTLQFNVTSDIPIDLMEIMKKDDAKTDQEKDLFKRASKTSLEDYQKYIDVVKSAELEFYKPKFPIKSSGGMSLTVDWGSGQRTECVLKDDTNALIAVNPSTLLNTYPLEPSIKLVIGKGSFGLPRDMEMETRLKLRVKAEGPIQIYPFAGQEAH